MMNSQNIWLQHGWDSRQCIWILEASPYIRQQQHTKRETQGKKYLKRQTNQQSKSFYFAPNRKRHCTFLLLPAWDCSIRKSKMPFFPTSGRKISSSSLFAKYIASELKIFQERYPRKLWVLLSRRSPWNHIRKTGRNIPGVDAEIVSKMVLRDLILEIKWYNVKFVSLKYVWYFQWLSINYVLGKFQHAEHLGNDEVEA